MKKTLLLVLIAVFAWNSVCFAAIGGSKVKVTAPRVNSSTTQSSPSTGYKPSAPAASYNEKAPNAVQTPKTANLNQQTATGGFWKKAALFGGGMLLGGLVGSMFGFGGNGLFASLAGLIVNLMVLGGIFLFARYLWTRYKTSKKEKS